LNFCSCTERYLIHGNTRITEHYVPFEDKYASTVRILGNIAIWRWLNFDIYKNLIFPANFIDRLDFHNSLIRILGPTLYSIS